MPSPFPGMNPYLEQTAVWHSFHEQFLPYCQEALVPQVRPRYLVKLDEHVYLHERTAGERAFLGRADASVTGTGRSPGHAGSAAATALLDAPAVARLAPVPVDAVRELFLEIRDRSDRRVVTVIELLSPSNKAPGPDRDQYLDRRRRLLQSDVNLVEIDLLRGGRRPPLEGVPACDYCVTVSRPEDRPDVAVWPLRLRDVLPTVPVPLAAGEPAARLDLGAVLRRAWEAGGYEDYVYDGRPEPALSPEDEAWARAMIGPPRAPA